MKHKVSDEERYAIKEQYDFFNSLRNNGMINITKLIESSGVLSVSTFRCWISEFEKDEETISRRKTHISLSSLLEIRKHLKASLLDILYED